MPELGSAVPLRVFISYAQDDDAQVERVREFWLFLRAHGVDARLDLPAAERRQDWAQWMEREIRDADRIVVIASPEYPQRDSGDSGPDVGRGVQWESRMIRERVYADQAAGLELVLPVVLPGGSATDLPLWLAPASSTTYRVTEYSVAGAERLLRVLTGQPLETEPGLGPVPLLPPRGTGMAARPTRSAGDGLTRPALRTQVVIDARLAADGEVASAVWLGGSLLCEQVVPLPVEVAGVWGALRLPALVAAERMAEAGRRLAGVLFDEAAQELVAGVLDRLPPGDEVEVALVAEGLLLSLPLELVRLGRDGGQSRPLGLLGGVSVVRRLAPASRETAATPLTARQPIADEATAGRPLAGAPAGDEPMPRAPTADDPMGGALGAGPGEPPPAPPGLPGPLKVLAAVAAPDATKTRNAPLDVEAEMQAVLDAVSDLGDRPGAQVRILEVASLAQIRQALERDVFHVLHLSAHGSAGAVELEDEDGNPVTVTAGELMQALRQAGRSVPLIVLSSCSGGSASDAMAAGLVERGADRVIAMLAPVTDGYATVLARHLYQQLAARQDSSVGQALGRARRLAEEERARASRERARAGGERARDDRERVPLPEYGVATLLAAAGDGPLVDAAAASVLLTVATGPAGDGSVRELPVGVLIGRRAELRAGMSVLRHDPAAVRQFGAASGLVLTGIGGIGKTALAGRMMSRLREGGWLIAVHEGRWNPTALIVAITEALAAGPPRGTDPAQAAVMTRAVELLADPGLDDGPKLSIVARLLETLRLLVVFDDYEQNLVTGGQEFLDPAADDALTALADGARDGALLVTCRYPLPGPDRFLAEIPVPALSAAELRRMFLRLPALAALDPADQRLLIRVIGGHPRLIEFTDALLRGGHSSLRHVQARLRGLAAEHGVDLRAPRQISQAVDQAMILGSADILLSELLALLTSGQAAILAQVAVCRAPMTADDLVFALGGDGDSGPDPTELRADVARLADLTLLGPGPDITMHPWTSEMVGRSSAVDADLLHERALAMRLHRFQQGQGTYDDLLDIPRHLAVLGRYDDIADIANQAVRMLPGTLATGAYLAELSPLIPPTHRAWSLVADLEVESLLSAGNLPAASRQLWVIYRQDEARAATDPANTEWQRDLSVSHNKLGNVATAAGDLIDARAHYQSSLDIITRLTTADPANTQWQRDLSISHEKLGDIATAAGDLTDARTHYQARLDIITRLTAADPANAEWQGDLSFVRQRMADLEARATGS